MEKKYHYIVAGIFSLFIGLFFFANLIFPDRDFSPNENRTLQPFPRFSLASLADGSFTDKAEKYASDQFVLRDRWIELKARLELLLGRRENNGVFLCDGQLLLEPFHAPDTTLVEKRTAAVNALASQVDIPVILALVPRSSELYGSLLPEGVDNCSQSAIIDQISSSVNAQTVDLAAVLSAHKDEYVFYRTDHHWTSLGALYGAEAISQATGVNQVLVPDSYPRKTVSESFFGTAYSSSGFFWIEPDRMEVFVEPSDKLVVSRIEGQAVEDASLYDYSMLDTKDKYRFFLGGNCPLIRISTGNDTLPSLLIIRDSYADSLVPFLLDNYSEIHMLDLRYYHDSVLSYAENNNIDSVLILYGLSNWITDPNTEFMTR